MRVARVFAQAKINLFLHVGAREPSGYHEIFTLFQRIDLADEVVVRAGGRTRSIDCSGPRLPSSGLGPPEQNLAYRAAVAYARHAGWLQGFAIEVTKHIPVGGGLGGGSADAGAVLRALDALAPEPLGPLLLDEITGSLGADVAFLTSSLVLAVGTGRGNALASVMAANGLEIIHALPVRHVLLAIPDFSIGTADAYRWLDEAGGGTMGPSMAPLLAHGPTIVGATGVETWDAVAEKARNDFETALEPRFPKLRELREGFDAAGARIARLSGSGSTVFAVFEGAVPQPRTLGLDALVIPTRTSARVVQVEVLE
jgi:4-diphosphocytidyl-2-C-methyl-D-erythritol kinase